ncbi:murein hydrolase activator EnvC family protein [Maledivibacter halophilus]|uniref:Septal ring factor EnvC, activator of murein hydrolases AmiA and AmiB n=1 Tax=Maledivibacter halophilus TaxID=36842 RepID=A0A1T5JHU6_9FIRM|nr:M23 family metallopeptidase [Maledivibacter halophilus]SKC51009.1 Septal ring factor EnvC, activator of murein hydrolases AmiA and AmiB [Maledivibacter halophilus]
MSRKKTLVVFVSLFLIFTMAFEAFAFNTDKDKQKLDEVTKEKEEVTKQKKQNEKQQGDITQKIHKLEENIRNLEGEIAQINKDINETKGRIETTKGELIKAEENLSTKNETFNSRLEVMYKNGDVGYIEVLLGSTDFEDLLTRIDMVKRLVKHDTDLLKYLKEQRDLIENKKITLENQKSQLLTLMNNTKKKQEDLRVSRGAMQRAKKELEKNHVALEKQEDELADLAERIKEVIIRNQSDENYVGGQMTWPAPGVRTITSPFGYRIHPILRRKKLHTGIDIGIGYGENIVAAQSGKVMYADWQGGYGKVVMIDHGGGIVTLYAHNSKLLVKEGQRVERGQVISKCGSTGMSTGAHLHFEVRENGQYVNPEKYVKRP